MIVKSFLNPGPWVDPSSQGVCGFVSKDCMDLLSIECVLFRSRKPAQKKGIVRSLNLVGVFNPPQIQLSH